MARICSQEAVNAVGNRYDLILIAAARARELSNGATPMVSGSRSNVLTALKEIEAGYVGREYLKKNLISKPTRSKKY